MEKEEIYNICKSIIDINKQKFEILKDEIEFIIRNNIKDEMYIQRKLDELLDVLLFYENEDTLLLFRKLSKYYFGINPQVTADYINFYKEQNDPDGIKFGNKLKTKTN